METSSFTAGTPRITTTYFFYDLDGERVAFPRFSAQVYDVLLKIDGDNVYVLGFDLEEDSYFVDRIPEGELTNFAMEQEGISSQLK